MSINEVAKEQIETGMRIRQIRESMKLSQEKFAELIEISPSGLMKLESGENHISMKNMRKLVATLSVSSDYVLFGKHEDSNEVWKMILNCSERDKMFLLMRLILYFTKIKETTYCTHGEQDSRDKDIIDILERIVRYIENK